MRIANLPLLAALIGALGLGAVRAGPWAPVLLEPHEPDVAGPALGEGTATITGFVFEDTDGSGSFDQGEPMLPNITIRLTDSDGFPLSEVATSALGRFTFSGLEAPATYCVREIVPAGYYRTTPDEQCVPVDVGGNPIPGFGLRPNALATLTLTPTPWGRLTSTATLTPTASPTASPTTSVTATVLAVTSTPSLTPSPSGTPTETTTPTRTPTVTATPPGWIDVSRAFPAFCRGVFNGDTTGKANNVWQYGVQPPVSQWPETGPEDVYVIHKTMVSDLTVTIECLSGRDLDIFLLYDAYPTALLDGADRTFTHRSLAPGTYYVIVDGYEGASGQYRLTVDCEGEPTPTPTRTLLPTPTNTRDYSFWPVLFKEATPTPTRTPVPTETPVPTVTPTLVTYVQAVNCGSATGYQASDGYWYAPDQPFAPGSWGWDGGTTGNTTATTHEIYGTVDGPLYQSHRHSMQAYRFTVPNGRYEVLLRFAEIFCFANTGKRVFHVGLEGQTVIDHLDVYARAGGCNRAWDQMLTAFVGDGELDITLEAETSSYTPIVNGIRVVRVGNLP